MRDIHPPTCEVCGSQFSKPSELALHAEIHIAGSKERRKYPCLEPGCGKSFTQKSNLVTHINDFHVEHKTFVCGEVDPRTLTRIENWDGSDACGRSLSSKGNLIQHIRTVHLRLEPSRKAGRKQKAASVKASTSDRASSTMDLLTGKGYDVGRKLECQVEGCDYRFRKEYDMHRHLDIYHGLTRSEMQLTQAHADFPIVRRCLDGSYYMANAAEDEADRHLSQQFGNLDRDDFDGLEDSTMQAGASWMSEEAQAGASMPDLFDVELMDIHHS